MPSNSALSLTNLDFPSIPLPMSSTTPYLPLGQFIRPIDERNRDGLVTNLLGVSVNKCFIPSVANTIGTDMSKYKVVRKGQFVYIPDTSRRGDKIALAYNKDNECIVSQAYIVFEVSDTKCLLPEYMMLWFLRPEFDRYARFYSHGSAREVFDWETLCATCIPVPPMEEQTRIVSQFATLEKRISLCKARISLLERTASALYRKTFVDGIDRNNLPDGWRMGTLGEVGKVKTGGDMPQEFSIERNKDYSYPIIANGLENKGVVGYAKIAVIREPSISISARGTIGYSFVRNSPYYPIVRLISITPYKQEMLHYLWFEVSAMDLAGSGSVQSQLTIPVISREEIRIPPKPILESFEKKVVVLRDSIHSIEAQIDCIERTKKLLLTQIK